jgi:hypothetical protein
MRHPVLVAVTAGVVTSALTTVLVSGFLFGAGSARSAGESTPNGSTGAAGGSPGSIIQGDVDCDGTVNAVDALKDLRYVVSLPVEQNEPCANIGAALAITGYERVTLTDSVAGPNVFYKGVPCSGGKKAFGGGVRLKGGSVLIGELNWVVLESYPLSDAWGVFIEVFDTATREFEFSAVCANAQ